MKGTYCLNNSGSRFIVLPKQKILVFHGSERYCKMRTIAFYESFGNDAVACLKYKGKMVKAFIENIKGTPVFFVDYKEKYKI